MNGSPRKHPGKGFTLTEILVVILIIGVLALVSNSVYVKMRQKANSAVAVQSLRQLGSLVLGLAQEDGKMPNEGAYPNPEDDPPADTSWDGYVLAYMGASDVIASTPPQVPQSYESIFFHPNDYPDPIETANYPTAKRTFVYLRVLSDVSIAAIDDPSRTGMLGEHPWRTDGRNRVGFKSASFMDMSALVPDPLTGDDLNPDGKFNFVFADGHIETLTREESAGSGSTSKPLGLWTLDPAD